MANELVTEIIRKKNPCIVGLDPVWEKIPSCYKEKENTCLSIQKWCCDVIDAVADIVPCVKPQIAFFESYGSKGIKVLEDIITYAHQKGLLVIEDCKRGDIGNTAKAYAFAHLNPNGPFQADFITVNPFLGMDSVEPFIKEAIKHRKGIFILTRTSNVGAIDFQDAITSEMNVSEKIAHYIQEIAEKTVDETGYSMIGAVVGATFFREAIRLRKIMKNNFFLVPGYGAQGGTAEDCLPYFNADGLGAIISSSRQILYTYQASEVFQNTRESYRCVVRNNCIHMRQQVYQALKDTYPNMVY